MNHRDRLTALHNLPCMACEIEGVGQPNRTEAHHLVWLGKRRGHQDTIALCGWHHRGEPMLGWGFKQMAQNYGPSLALSKREFVARYGTEDELLAKVNALLGIVEPENAGGTE